MSGPERVLVTGASGHVGRSCVEALVEQRIEVHALSRGVRPATSGVTWHRVDLLDTGAADTLVRNVRPSHLLHLAWVTEHGRFWHAAENMDWLSASLALVRSFAEYGGRRAAVVGTCAEYRWGESVLSETSSPLEPATLYGASKHALHVVLEAFAARSELSLVWPRLFSIYGPGEDERRLVPTLVRAMLRGEPTRLRTPNRVVDVLYAPDAAEALTQVLLCDLSGAVNVASGRAVRVHDLAILLGELTGRPDLVGSEHETVPTADDKPLVADVHRLTSETGWRERHDLESGLRATLAGWRVPAG